MLMLMRHDKMESTTSSGSSGRHVRTHLFFSDFDHRSNGRGSDNDGSYEQNQRRHRASSNNKNNNNYYQESDFLSSPIADPSRPLPVTPSMTRGRRGFGRENSRSDVPARTPPPPNHNNRPPFIQISCPKQVDNNVSPGRSGSVKKNSGLSTPVAGRQGSVNAGETPRNNRKLAGNGKIHAVQEDCFIVPAHRMGTFLPISLQFENEKSMGALSMLHVDDPKLCIILHFAEPSSSFHLQLAALKSSLARVDSARNASEGMLLMNMEKNASYPFIMYLVINTVQTSPCVFLQSYNSIIVDELQPDQQDNRVGTNYISGYEEVATIARPPIDIGPKTSSNPKTGYLISIFKVFPGDDREKLERSWLLWTGARMIYKHLPDVLGLRRITFHKKLWPDGGITYILMCECTSLLDNITVACGFVEQLRARCCGYTALYKSVGKF